MFTWVTVFILFKVQKWQIDLKVSVDVESNPGPTYVIEKAVLESLHQGDRRFGETAGIQCASNSLYLLC